MLNTPLITKISPTGTLVTFPSASEDLTLSAFNNNNIKFRFSKYVAINIPPIQQSSNGNNTIQFENVEGHFTKGLSSASPPPEGDRFDFVESLQNYALNLETLLTQQSTYDPDTLLNVSERVFWKWLKEIGAIRYRSATSSESLVSDRYVEENDSDVANLYSRVVRFIGEIDQENNYRNAFNAFKELLLYLPTQCGTTPVSLFKTVSDNNYFPSQTIQQTGSDNVEFIQGQDSNSNPSAAGLDVRAFYDMDVPSGSFDYETNGVPDQYWFKNQSVNGANSYYTDTEFNNPINESIVRTDNTNNKTISYIRNRLDGVVLDFDTNSYTDFQTIGGLNNFIDYANTDNSEDYEFNAILIYYDLYDENNPEAGTIQNLFGVLFLDDLEVFSTSAAKIPTISKYRPDPILNKNGTSYGIRVSLKFDVNADNVNTDIEVDVNDYNTFSTQLYAEAITKISSMDKNLESTILQLNHVQQELININNFYQNIVNLNISEQFDSLRNFITENAGQVNIDKTILDIQQTISNILSGNTSVSVTSLFNIIGKNGMLVNNDGVNIVISNNRQRYSSISQQTLNTTTTDSLSINNVPLGIYDTMLIHQDNQIRIMKQNLQIYVDDSVNRWQIGQVFVIKLNEPINFNNFGLLVYTDKPNRFDLPTPYSKLVSAIPFEELLEPKKYEISITCIDNINLKFIYTINNG